MTKAAGHLNVHDLFTSMRHAHDFDDADVALIVNAAGDPTMSVFLDQAKAVYLAHLMVKYDGVRAEVASAMGCSVTNVTRMLGRLNRKYGKA